ncbi:MAG: heme-dependent peroxidase [Candidatus Eremiobacteraeota bacterium]|nr:heme-dependent peroxidase [Candidatus Eremiobacteraeota bacterium]
MRNPNVPESLEGWWILHRMFSFDRRGFAALSRKKRARFSDEALELLQAFKSEDVDVGLAQIVGHKADLMLTHYARGFDGLAHAQSAFDRLELTDYLVPRESFTSILELGLYDATAKIHDELRSADLKPHSAEWNAAFDDKLRQQATSARNAERLWAKIPARRYVSFYPMDKKRGESVNWYVLPYADRARMMVEHGKIGRTFHGLVTQVISGAIGHDDWEWGVDLYADDPLVFKKLVYEMRFDEASAKYGAFGPFYSGVQFSISQLPIFLSGVSVPQLESN